MTDVRYRALALENPGRPPTWEAHVTGPASAATQDHERRTRRVARLLTWTGAAIVLGVVVGLVYAIHPLVA